jgi:hypothetical protein
MREFMGIEDSNQLLKLQYQLSVVQEYFQNEAYLKDCLKVRPQLLLILVGCSTEKRNMVTLQDHGSPS